MSLDVLSNLSKEVVAKKTTSLESKENVSSKKEGSSLFDSLMKGIQKEKESTSTEKFQKKVQKLKIMTKKLT